MEIEEIVARALCKEDGHDPDEWASHFTDEKLWMEWREAARAALRALEEAGYAVVPREATPEMQKAALGAFANLPDPKASAWDAMQGWRAMLDAASASPLPPDPA